jgi:hypothetical protein
MSGLRAELVLLRSFSLLHFLEIYGDLVDLAGELIGRANSIILSDRRLSVFTDICSFVGREYDGSGGFDASFSPFLAIDKNRIYAASIIGELIAVACLPDRHRRLGGHGEALKAQKVVRVGGLPSFRYRVQPPSRLSCFRQDCATSRPPSAVSRLRGASAIRTRAKP